MKRSPNKAMAPCVQRATVYALWGMLLLALPQFARASALAPAGFGLSGFPQLVMLLIVSLLVMMIEGLGEHLRPLARAKVIAFACLLYLALEVGFLVVRDTPAWVSSTHEGWFVLEQVLYMTLVMQWMLRMHADATAHDYGLQDGLRAESDDKRPVGDRRVDARNYPRIVLALFGGLTLSSLGMDVVDAWLSSFFAQQGFALPVDFAMGLSAFAFAACALLPLRAWLASGMGLHAYLLVYYCSKVSALMLMRLVPAAASLSIAAIFGVALASILILLLVAVHLKRGHVDGSVEYEGQELRANTSLVALDGIDALSSREREVLDLTLQGLTQKEIGAQLGVSVATAGTYRTRAYRKLGLASKEELIALLEARRQVRGNSTQVTSADLAARRSQVLHPLLASAAPFLFVAAVLYVPLSLLPFEVRFALSPVLVVAVFAVGIVLLFAGATGRAPGHTTEQTTAHTEARDKGIANNEWGAACILACCLISLSARMYTDRSYLDPNSVKLDIVLIAVFSIVSIVRALGRRHRAFASAQFPSLLDRNQFYQRACSLFVAMGYSDDEAKALADTCLGKTAASIAKELYMSPSRVRACRTCAYRQLGVRDSAEFRRAVSRLIAAQFT
ncbi:response regulator transcription factor [Collinsella tanakaei]|uniref:response regulator transcription factor n=1 Tax=Collinsella tanakaei TaxID=626935 RepID=UPI003AB48C2A